jgi:hypothetical protein
MQKKSLWSRLWPPALGLAALLFVVSFLGDPVQTVKWIGAPFLVVPQAIGALPTVSAEDVRVVPLREASPALDVPQPGQYALYAADDQMQMRANMLADVNAAWVRLLPLGAKAEAEIVGTAVKRGAAIYDPIAVAGRPVATFAVPAAGRYELVYPRQSGELYFGPDPISGREGVVLAWIAGQAAVIAAAIVAASWPRILARRARARAAAAELARKRAATDEFLKTR